MAPPALSFLRRAAALGLAALLAGCSSLPPWLGGTRAENLAPLPPIDGGAVAGILWQVQLGGRHASLLTPALAGDRIVAAHPDGTIIVVDAASGAQTLRFSAGSERGALAGGVGASDDLIVVTTVQGWTLAFDYTGKRLWEARVPTEAAAPAAIADGIVSVTAVDGSMSGLDAQTGNRKWFLQRQLPPLTLRSASIPIALRGGVFWGTPLGRLLALDIQTGAIGWEATVANPRGASELERLIDVLGRPSVDDQRICAAAYQGRVACFDLIQGTLLWNREISSLVGTVMDARHVYSVDEKGVAYALDKSTGATVWRRDVLAGRRASGLALVGDRLAIHDLTGHLHFVSTSDGRIVARALGDGFAASAPMASTGQAAVVQTRSGQLLAVSVR